MNEFDENLWTDDMDDFEKVMEYYGWLIRTGQISPGSQEELNKLIGIQTMTTPTGHTFKLKRSSLND